jgi:hypothetical protein
MDTITDFGLYPSPYLADLTIAAALGKATEIVAALPSKAAMGECDNLADKTTELPDSLALVVHRHQIAPEVWSKRVVAHTQNPAIDRAVVDRDTTLTHHLLKVAVSYAVAAVPPDCPEHDLALEVPPRAGASNREKQGCAQISCDLAPVSCCRKWQFLESTATPTR